jgi:GAF domain-containing protein
VSDPRPGPAGAGGTEWADVITLASGVSEAVSGSPGLDEMLEAIARRVAEAMDVWECNIYEYRPETDTLVATALWASETTPEDEAWLGTIYPVADRPSYQLLVAERVVRERQVDDPAMSDADVAAMERWGERSVLSVPLVFQDEVVGALTLVEKRAPRRFGEDDLRLLGLLAMPAAVAVHTARTLRREAEQARRLAALLAASRAMTSTIDLDELLATITHAAREALDTAECSINTYDPQTDTMTVVALEQREPEPGWERWIGRSYALDDFPADRRILLGGQIVEERVSDPDLDEKNRADMLENDEKSFLNVPLVYEDEPIGFLVFIETEEERRFTEEERRVAAALGEQAAAAIHHAQLLRRAAVQNRRLELLLESTRAVSSSVDLDEVLDIVARAAAELLGSQECQIQEYDPVANTVRPVALWQRTPDDLARSSLGRVFSLEDEPEERAFLEAGKVLEQRYSDPDLPATTRALFDKFGDRAYLNVPLVFNGQPVGVLVLVEKTLERHWTEDEVALATALAEQAAVAIEHARLYKRVQDQAVTDGLTGLYNHRHFYERLEHEIARARRYGTPVSLLMIDLDDFKAFNDRNGHLAGDAVLRALAAVLTSELRQHLDLAARYGGEEFAVILPNTPLTANGEAQMEMDLSGRLAGTRGETPPPPPGHAAGAEQVAERIRSRVAGLRLHAAAAHGECRRRRLPPADELAGGSRGARRCRALRGQACRQGPGRSLWVRRGSPPSPRATWTACCAVSSRTSAWRWISGRSTSGASAATRTLSRAAPTGAAMPPWRGATTAWAPSSGWTRATTCDAWCSPPRVRSGTPATTSRLPRLPRWHRPASRCGSICRCSPAPRCWGCSVWPTPPRAGGSRRASATCCARSRAWLRPCCRRCARRRRRPTGRAASRSCLRRAAGWAPLSPPARSPRR